MARVRTQKAVARRIDLSYFQRAHPLRTGRKVFTFLVGFLAIAFVTFFSLKGAGRLHNPGALTAAHAAWQHDCRQCHDGDGKGGLSKEVSDASCLKCHDGAMHHPNQLDNTLVKWTSSVQAGAGGTGEEKAGAEKTVAEKGTEKSAEAMAGAGPHSAMGPHLTAANCVSCHTEHRGHDLLVGTNSELCITCHADLKNNSKMPPQVVENVTAFALVTHPHFGRNLTTRPSEALSDTNAPFDNTLVKFNHAKHNGMAALKDNCVACHETSVPSLAAKAVDPDKKNDLAPPYTVEGDRPVNWTRSDDQRQMAPIDFARHCVQCHTGDLTLAPTARDTGGKDGMPIEPQVKGLVLLHADLSTVRLQIAAAVDAQLNEKTKFRRTPPKTGRGPTAKSPPPIEISQGEWTAYNLNFLSSETGKLLKGVNVEKWGRTVGADYAAASLPTIALPKSIPATQPIAPADVPTTVSRKALIDYYTAYALAKNCATCHAAEGTLPTLDPAVPFKLATAGTLIPDGPRQWFEKGKAFDHRAHRMNSCLDCHASAAKSELTSEFNSPWKIDQGGAASCISCHKPDVDHFDGVHRGAPNNCTTCHEFHDPLAERKAFGTFDVRKGTALPTTRVSHAD